MIVKICGITRLEDAEAAIALGAGAVGFICWPESPRFIAADAIRAITARLPAAVLKVGVFVNEPVAAMHDTAARSGFTHVQLHGDETAGTADGIGYPLIRAVSLAAGPDPIFSEFPPDTIWLVDAADPVRRGGTGRLSDWTAATALARKRRVWLAGGLTPENVSAAIAEVRPDGIDVSSGVECAPGVKDHDKLRALFAAVQQAVADVRNG